MGFLENLKERRQQREARLRRFEDDDRILHNIERKKLSHNEREMIAVLKAEKEKYLKEALRQEEIRRKHDELFRERKFMMGGFNLME